MKRYGFSLVELMISMVIAALLMGGVTVTARRLTDTAPYEASRDMAIIAQGASIYGYLYGKYPDNISELFSSQILLGENRSPWNTGYEFLARGDKIYIWTRDQKGKAYGTPP